MDTTLSCPASNFDHFGVNSLASKSLASALFLGLSGQGVDSFISFVSLQSTYNWYLKLTQFETIFLCILMLQVVILRYLEILPINVNNWFSGDPSGRRKRSLKPSRFEDDPLSNSIFALLRKLDDQECLLKTLCELQSHSLRGHKFTKETRNLLTALNTSGKKRFRNKSVPCTTESNDVTPTQTPTWTMQTFEMTVIDGAEDNRRNGTYCAVKYKQCDTPSVDIIDYVDIMSSADFL